MTEEVVAPLDAYATAKPDEPTFTPQGGDPLAAPLVRLWALLARRRSGILRFSADHSEFAECIEAAIGNDLGNDEREKQALLVRAVAAEEVSWAMDSYVKGEHEEPVDKPTLAADTHLTELERIDLHDARVRAAQRINNMVAELTTLVDDFGGQGRKFWDEDQCTDVIDIIETLRRLSGEVEPRRLFKKD